MATAPAQPPAPPRHVGADDDNADADADADDASRQLTFTCQLCRARISLTGELDGSMQLQPSHPRPAAAAAAAAAAARGMDESFVVLPTTAAAAAAAHAAAAASSTPPLLPPPPPPQQHTQPQTTVDAKLQALTALFEAASTSSGADHPLCLDCAARLRDELALQEREARDEASAYEAALRRLQAGRRRPVGGQEEQREQQPQEQQQQQEETPPLPPSAVPPAAFQAELSALQARERAARRRAADSAARLTLLRAELAALERTDAARLDALAVAYWQDAQATQAALDHHVSERDALLAKTERATQRLAVLRGTSALNDACRIWHEGPFGTIGGFRLGRTPEQPVPWDEINAAWGLAVLLLSAMARSARVTFSGARRLLPLGSRARVADARGTHDLFGPVSRLWTAPYDRAMVAYVGCLAEFGEFARARDLAEGGRSSGRGGGGGGGDPPFEFPFPVDGAAGTVGGHSVRLALNKEAKWTRALKLMLADLKVALQWAARREAGAQQARGGRGGGGGGGGGSAAQPQGQQRPQQQSAVLPPLAPETGGGGG
jgi:beclin